MTTHKVESAEVRDVNHAEREAIRLRLSRVRRSSIHGDLIAGLEIGPGWLASLAEEVREMLAEQRAKDWEAEKRARALAEKIDRCTAHMRDVLGYAEGQPDAGLESLVVQAKHLRHPPVVSGDGGGHP